MNLREVHSKPRTRYEQHSHEGAETVADQMYCEEFIHDMVADTNVYYCDSFRLLYPPYRVAQGDKKQARMAPGRKDNQRM